MAEMPQYMNKVTAWDLVVKAYSANETDLSFYKPKHEELVAIRDRFRELTAERAALNARKLEVAKEMRTLFREGETLADALRTTARQHYGLNSEKLVEFGMQPNRPRSRNSLSDRSKPPGKPEPVTPASPATAADTEPAPASDPRSSLSTAGKMPAVPGVRGAHVSALPLFFLSPRLRDFQPDSRNFGALKFFSARRIRARRVAAGFGPLKSA